jgi:sulfur carrier protein
MRKIEVQLNGASRELDEGLTVAGLLAALAVPIAIAIVERNGEVVPKSRFDEEIVGAGDRIEIVRLMGGG